MAGKGRDVQQYSDSELRERLRSYGEFVGPVTETTRNVLRKKLAKLMDSQGQNLDAKRETERNTNRRRSTPSRTTSKTPSSRRSVGKQATPDRTSAKRFAPFSSDEESDITPAPKQQDERQIQQKSRPVTRKSVPANFRNSSAIQEEANQSKPSQNLNLVSNIESQYSDAQLASSSRSTWSSMHDVDDKNANENAYQRRKSSGLFRSDFSDDDITGRSVAYQSKGGQSSISNLFSNINGSLRPRENLQNINTRRNKSESNTLETGDRIIDKKKSIDASFVNSDIKNKINLTLSEVRQSFLSKKPTESPVKRSYFDAKDINSSGSEYEYDEELEANFMQSNAWLRNINIKDLLKKLVIFLGIIVLLILAIFFAFRDTEENLPAITGSQHIGEQLMVQRKKFLNCLYKDLSRRLGDFECGYIDQEYIQVSDLKKSSCFLKETYEDDILDMTLNVMKDERMTDYFRFSGYESTALASKHSIKSLQCRISEALSTIIFRATIFVTVLLVTICVYYVLKRRWMTDDEEARQMLYFVNKIIETLKRHHLVCMNNKDLPQYLPIPHVRDMLIPVTKRKEMAKIWQKAVDFVNASDSRIRMETQQIAGEDFEVWRWIGVCTPKAKKQKIATSKKLIHSEQNKCWQGPAFEEIEKVVRMPIVTPTPCLKIRYMHEGFDEKEKGWITRVEDAILEKCTKDNAQILHIYVDVASKEGCVYVKCANLDSAGRAFRSIYGNWFDGRLVVVKFVTLARYHQRFPDALNATRPLAPSGKYPSSMTWTEITDK